MTSACPRCELLPDALPTEGVLYILPPISESRVALKQYLRLSGQHFDEPHAGIFAIPYGPGGLKRLCSDFLCRIGHLEMQDTRTLVLEPGVHPDIADLARMQPLSALVARMEGDWLTALLREERLGVHFQPIVPVADPGTPFAYECLARGFDEAGGMVPPDRMFSVAREADMLFHLDRACRLAVIREATSHGAGPRIFVNFNPTAIYNPDYCLRTTLAAIEEHDLSPAQVVFEVVESDEIRDTGHLRKVLEFYRERGFLVALDDMGAGFSSLNLLAEMRPDFVKFDMGLVRGVDRDDYKARILAAMLDLSAKLGVRSIAEGVETRGEWAWLADNGADLAQGYLLARPAADPPRPAIPR